MLIPEKGVSTRSYSISKISVVISLAATFGFLSMFGFLLHNYIIHYGLSSTNTSLTHENASMKNEMASLLSRLKDVQRSLDKVNQFYTKLKVWSNVEDLSGNSTNNKSRKGIGPISDEEYAFSNQTQLSGEEEIVPRAINESSLIFKDVFSKIDLLDRVSASQLINMQTLMKSLTERMDVLSSRPNISPAKGWITSLFGMRMSPFTGRKTFHAGLDVAAAIGTPIIAPAEGIVVFTGRKGSYGNSVIIDHDNGIVTLYAHIHEMFVRVGQKVKRGDRIASIGNTGRSTGPHLHYEVIENGRSINPISFILD